MVRVPSVRRPISFFGVFTVTAVSITAVAVALSVWHGSFVRLEMGAFIVLVFAWVVWAIGRILDESVREPERPQRRDPCDDGPTGEDLLPAGKRTC